MSPALQGLITIIIGVGGCVGYFYFSNLFLDKVLFPASGPNAGRNINRAGMIRPWLFLAPALIALTVYLAYPVVETLRLSLTQRVPGGGYVWVGFDNYRKMSGEPKFWEALRNNMLWLIVVPAMSTAFGLLAAQLSDRIRWGNLAKSLIFMPMAISFVGAAVIWKLVYDTRPVDQEQIGVLNAVWLAFEGGPMSVLFLKIVPSLGLIAFAAAVGLIAWVFVRPMLKARDQVGGGTIPLRLLVAVAALWLIYMSLRSVIGLAGADLPYGVPQTWLTIPFWNSFFLMIVLVWIQTGFAMVILSAALRGVPEDTIEAAIVDGANPFQIFFKIKVPQIMGTIVVVWTTITIVVLKVFDIVFAMSNGQWETQVLANYMYDKLFRANDWGVGSASAMVIMLLVTPILIWNVYNARKEMR
ncbi:carbohydrate ABC transporter permease [Pseudotabrizicola algicola]|uniref:Sugar ABC transporter permease n=1 Tax=Pseudotabrizicola algicola TaxID=2709381 RepID=A0A6B3RPJ6_9RHOB|nr:sugar ABC transporter permease [Pseudotabrizicola algicola]NEX45029.1 sugar ABC transporter permease [Pseudotabrizicola algicola]